MSEIPKDTPTDSAMEIQERSIEMINNKELDYSDHDKIIFGDHEMTHIPTLTYTTSSISKKKRLKASKKPPKINIKPNKFIKSTKSIKQVDKPIPVPQHNISYDENVPWNYYTVLFLIRIAEKAGGYRWMHNIQQKRYEKKDSIYNWIDRLITALVTCFTGVSIFLEIFKADNYIVTIVVVGTLQILLIFMMILIGETHISREYQKKISSCTQTAHSFSEIEMEIKTQIALKIQFRDNEPIFVERIMKKYNTTLDQSPSLDNDITNKHAKAIITDDFTLPVNLDMFDDIPIKHAKQKYKKHNPNKDPELGLIEEAENLVIFDDSKNYRRQVARFLAAT